MNIEQWESKLLDYFAGTLPLSEKREVEEWIGQSEEYQKMARDIRYIYSATDVLNDIKRINAPKALRETKKKIHRQKRIPFVIRFQQVAAILLLPLLLGTLYLTTKQEAVKYIEVRTNPGMITSVELPDGSRVWLNSRSYLRYPQTFHGDVREVELDGEAYFSVEKDQSKRFVVNTPFEVKAEVLGTEFNLEAYKEQGKATTTLVSGSVKLRFRNEESEEKSILMKPDEEVSYSEATGGIKVSKPYVATQTAWKDGLVIFRNTPFEQALNILGKRFNVEFIVKNNTLYRNSFTGTFDGQHLSLILEHFRLASDIKYHFVDPDTKEQTQAMEKTIVELY